MVRIPDSGRAPGLPPRGTKRPAHRLGGRFVSRGGQPWVAAAIWYANHTPSSKIGQTATLAAPAPLIVAPAERPSSLVLVLPFSNLGGETD